MLHKNIICVIIVIIISSCSKNSSIESEFEFSIKQLDSNFDECKAVVIIPGAGCTGCITYVESFLKEYYDNNVGVKFILTSIESMKILKFKTGVDLGHENILIDDLNVFSKGVFNSIYPTFIFFDDKGEVSEVRYASLEDNGVEVLKSRFFSD